VQPPFKFSGGHGRMVPPWIRQWSYESSKDVMNNQMDARLVCLCSQLETLLPVGRLHRTIMVAHSVSYMVQQVRKIYSTNLLKVFQRESTRSLTGVRQQHAPCGDTSTIETTCSSICITGSALNRIRRPVDFTSYTTELQLHTCLINTGHVCSVV
jgi:hypothetical protein